MKEIKFNLEARESVLKGINVVADAVKSTYGPNGRNVIIDVEGDNPHITKDGVTVANSIQLDNNFESIGVKLIQGVASKTLKDVGDGTSSSTILTQAIINEGVKEIEFGVNPFKIKQGIDIAVKEITDKLKENATILEQDSDKIKSVGLISTNGDIEISNLLYNIFSKIGKEGIVNVNDSTSLSTYFEIIEGIKIQSGYDNPLFVKDNNKIIFNKPKVFISKDKITQMTTLVPILKEIQEKKEELIIIAPDINQEVLNTLIINNYNGTLKVVYIKLPGSTEIQRQQLDDLSVVIGNKFNMNSTTSGYLKQAIIEQYNSSFISLEKYLLDIEGLKQNIKLGITEIPSYENNKLKERIANLSGKVANIFLYSSSSIELNEKKDKLDDAIHAVKAALDEGVIVGAGITLKNVSEKLRDELIGKYKDDGIITGINIVCNVCKIPFYILNRTVVNEGIVLDPVKVIYVALQNASNIAGLFLTTNCIIANKNN